MPKKKPKAPKIEKWRTERLKLIRKLVERRKAKIAARELVAALKKDENFSESK